LFGCDGNNSATSGVPGLYLWSRQPAHSAPKVILFIHGRRGIVPDQATLEELFSFKLDNLDLLGEEQFGCRTSKLAKFWLYEYNSQQPVDQIAADLAAAIRANAELSSSQIAVVAYSEGGVVAWLLDQNYEGLISGGVLLGAPLLSTPLAHPDVRNAAIQEVVPNDLQEYAISVFDSEVLSTEFLQPLYFEDCEAKSDLAMFAGRIDPLNSRHISANLIMGYSTRLNHQQPTREAAKLAALLIQHSVWDYTTDCQFPSGYEEDWCHESDGVVPVASALWGTGRYYRIWPDYNHYDLLTGQGARDLDQATLEHLDRVLHLAPEFPEDSSIPSLPEISIFSAQPLAEARFAYVLNGQLILADAAWQSLTTISTEGVSSFPRFSSDGSNLVWTQTVTNESGIYLLKDTDAVATAIASGYYADFSPNGDWLVYQSSDELRIMSLSADQPEQCVIKGVDLICPPLWVTQGLVGKIYFVSRSANGTTDLYVVSPRVRDRELSPVDIVVANCTSIFLARGMINGIVAGSGTVLTPRFDLVSNSLLTNFSCEFQNDAEAPLFSWDKLDFMINTPDPVPVRAVTLDQADNFALYVETDLGIQLFSVTVDIGWKGVYCEDPRWDEVCPGAHQLDINPTVD
jgi:pimeloyl-ACP methyl ester carboxylesterase